VIAKHRVTRLAYYFPIFRFQNLFAVVFEQVFKVRYPESVIRAHCGDGPGDMVLDSLFLGLIDVFGGDSDKALDDTDMG